MVRVGARQLASALTFDPLPGTARRLSETQPGTYYRGDTPPHQEGVGSSPAAAIT